MTEDEARKLFRDAADAADSKLPKSIASKLSVHLREFAEYDFNSSVSQLVVGAWVQCARDLLTLELRGEGKDGDG